MQWDLGWQGIGVLAGLAVGFAVGTTAACWPTPAPPFGETVSAPLRVPDGVGRFACSGS